MSVVVSQSQQSYNTANKSYKTAKSNTTVVQQGVPYHNDRLEKTKATNTRYLLETIDVQSNYTELQCVKKLFCLHFKHLKTCE